MEPMNQQRFTQEAAEGRREAMQEAQTPEQADRRADFQALIAGPYRREFEEAVASRVQYELNRMQADETQEEEDGSRTNGDREKDQRDAALRRHFADLTRQGEELKQIFPDFDLMTEMQNPAFVRMTAPETGVSVKDAFYAIHGEDIQRESMRYAALQAGRRIAASVQAGASRPVENGIQGAAPVMIGVDIRGMNKKQREEYRRRIHSGEIINFRDKF